MRTSFDTLETSLKLNDRSCGASVLVSIRAVQGRHPLLMLGWTAWQQLGEAQRQIRWLKMKQRERQLLGIDARRFMGSRYASLGGGYRPGCVEVLSGT